MILKRFFFILYYIFVKDFKRFLINYPIPFALTSVTLHSLALLSV